MKTLIYVLFSLLLFSACQEILYTEAQPNFKRNKSAFPKKMLGVYENDENKEVIRINENYAEILMRFDDLSVQGISLQSDTAELRKWRNIWFMNLKPSGEDFWRVAFVELDKDSLFISHIEENAELLEELTKVRREKNAEGDYIINPDRKEWKEILKQMQFNSRKFVRRAN